MEARGTTASGHDYVRGPSAEDSFERMFCAHDGNTRLHPPCYAGEVNNISHIVNKCIACFTGQRRDADWPQRAQTGARNRWTNQLQKHLGDLSFSRDDDLQFFVNLFADYFFSTPRNQLKPRLTVRWATTTSSYSSSSHDCHTELSIPSTQQNPRHYHPRTRNATIEIPKPDPSTFMPATGQCLLNTLLHQMAHAYLTVFSCDCNSCRCEVTRADTVGRTGHGPVWVRLCEAMKQEAQRVLRDTEGPWDLGCGEGSWWRVREQNNLVQFQNQVLVRVEMERRARFGS